MGSCYLLVRFPFPLFFQWLFIYILFLFLVPAGFIDGCARSEFTLLLLLLILHFIDKDCNSGSEKWRLIGER